MERRTGLAMATVGQRGANSPVTHATLLESLELLSRSLDRLDMAKSDTEFAEVLRNLVGFLGASNAPGAELWARKLSDAQETHARTASTACRRNPGFLWRDGLAERCSFSARSRPRDVRQA